MTTTNWREADWTLTTTALAKKYKVNRAAVSSLRGRYAPETIRPRKSKGLPDWENVNWELSNEEIAIQLKRTAPYVACRRRRLHPPTFVDWTKINWYLSNQTLATHHKTTEATVQLYRKKKAPWTLKPKIDWDGVDWSRKTKDIAHDLGVCITQVSRKRKVEAPKTMARTRGIPINWGSLDWRKSNIELASLCGCQSQTITYHRRKHAPHTLKKDCRRPCRT